MPQMENKKRYTQVQQVISPDKGLKGFTLFKEDAFIKETLAENFYVKKVSGAASNTKRPMTSDGRKPARINDKTFAKYD